MFVFQVLGCCFFLGGLGRSEQNFNITGKQMNKGNFMVSKYFLSFQ